MSSLIKEVKSLESRPQGWKAGIDINTEFGETYVEYRKTTDKVDMFGRGYGRAQWNDLSVWGDESFQAGAEFGISW